MSGRPLKIDITKKRKIIILVTPLVLTNLIVYMLCSDPQASPKYKNHVQTIVTAVLRTPFKKHKKVLLINSKSKIAVEDCVLLDIKDSDLAYDKNIKEVTISVKESQINKFRTDKLFDIYPNSKELLIKRRVNKRKGQNYEITY
jgi:hypothetical protein